MIKKNKTGAKKKTKNNKNRVRQILYLMRHNIKINLMMIKNDILIFLHIYIKLMQLSIII
jgi:hypothetical protein